jgi:hypothetical protein
MRILKISVLASGDVLLDGAPVFLPKLKEVLAQAEPGKSVVWYYRDNSADDPSASALEVMKLVTDYRLPIRLSTRPDFSDAVTGVREGVERAFASVRDKAAGGQLVLVRPDGRIVILPALDKAPPNAVAAVEKMLPSSVKRNVAAIADTAWTMDALNLQSASRAVPFFGLLMGFSCIGHAVWIFDANTSSLLNAGCRDADVLIVDGPRGPSLPTAWKENAQQVMRGKQILLYDRDSQQFRNA